MEDLMSVDFEEPVDLVITDPCYIDGDDGKWPERAYALYVSRHPGGNDDHEHPEDESVRLLSGIAKSIDADGRIDATARDFYTDALFSVTERLRRVQSRRFFWAPLVNGLEEVGLTRSLMGNTVYGDWTCGVFRGRDRIGQFTADAGMYIVARLDEVMRAWPGFGHWLCGHPHCAAVIRGFSGTVTVNAMRRLCGIVNAKGETERQECLDILIEGIGADPSMDFITKRDIFEL